MSDSPTFNTNVTAYDALNHNTGLRNEANQIEDPAVYDGDDELDEADFHSIQPLKMMDGKVYILDEFTCIWRRRTPLDDLTGKDAKKVKAQRFKKYWTAETLASAAAASAAYQAKNDNIPALDPNRMRAPLGPDPSFIAGDNLQLPPLRQVPQPQPTAQRPIIPLPQRPDHLPWCQTPYHDPTERCIIQLPPLSHTPQMPTHMPNDYREAPIAGMHN